MTRLTPPRRARAWASVALTAALCAALGSVAHAQSAAQSAADQALEAWDINEAEVMVERLMGEEPDSPWNLYLKGKLFLMQGDYRAAADWLLQAQTREPNLLFQHHLQLALNTHEETKDYARHRTKSGYFEIATAKGIDEILVPYAEDTLERAYRELTKIFDYTPELPIRIEFYPTVDVLGAVSPLTVAEIRTSGTIALCKYNRLMVTSPRDLVYGYDWLDTIAHELIHLLITKKSKNTVPIWLHEGLAKYYEVKWREGQKPELDRHSEAFLRTALDKDKLISFEAMSPSMAKLPSQEATATAFAEVWTVIAFLNDKRGKDVAAELVAAMRDGQSDREAVALVSGIPWDRFERAWKGYLKQQSFRPLDAEYQQRLLFKGKDTEADELAAIKIDRAREYVWLGDQMRLRKRWNAAILEYEKAKQHVGDRSPLVQGKLGYALLRAKRFEGAAEELGKPIVDHPRHVVLHVYLGEALLELGRYEDARRHLEEALTLNPFDPDVHGNLAKVYDHLGLPELAAREREADRRLKQE